MDDSTGHRLAMLGSRNFRERFSPTNLAVYHHNHCELYLWNTYHSSLSGDGSTDRTNSSLTIAHFERGLDWEAKLVAWLEKEDVLHTVLGPVLNGDDLVDLVSCDERDRFFMYGLKFQSPAFLEEFTRYGNAKRTVNFGVAKPDLVEFTRMPDGKIMWRIIDAKASKEVKPSHHVQIYWYHLCLTRMLNSSVFVPADTAAVWLQPDIGSASTSTLPSFDTLFSVPVHLLGPPLEDFFFRKLPDVVHAKAQKDVKWHYNPLCRGCDFETECRKRTVAEQTIGSIPNVSLGEAETLRSLLESARYDMSFDSARRELPDLEDLDRVCRDGKLLNKLAKKYPTTTRGAKRILNISLRNADSNLLGSSRVNAAQANLPQVVNRRSYTLPKTEDIAIVISLVIDPTTSSVGAYCINTYTTTDMLFDEPIFGLLPRKAVESGWQQSPELVVKLASHIQRIMDMKPSSGASLRTQVYTFSSAEKAALQQYLINTALTSPPTRDIHAFEVISAVKTCVGALCEGTASLQTNFQPAVLSGALLDFLHKKRNLSREQLIRCLARLGADSSTYRSRTTEELRNILEQEIANLQGKVASDTLSTGRLSTGSASTGSDRYAASLYPTPPSSQESPCELGQLPRVIALKREIERIISLSVPGYWDLPEAVISLLSKRRKCPTDGDIYSLYLQATRGQDDQRLKHSLLLRNKCIYDLLRNVRKRVDPATTGGPNLLVNLAKPINSQFMDICKVESLRKLFFMHQFEVLAKLQDLWQSRIDACPEAAVLEFRSSEFVPSQNGKYQLTEYEFVLRGGNIEQPPEQERGTALHGFVLVSDETSSDLPVEALFDDLPLAGLVFPLNKYTRSRWDSQHPSVRKSLVIANVRQVALRDQTTVVKITTYPSSSALDFVEGHRFRLSPRLVDFNTSKVLHTLAEMDLEFEASSDKEDNTPPFLNFVMFPSMLTHITDTNIRRTEQNINKWLRELTKLGNADAGALMLRPSQRRAATRIISSKLSIIWGPPGSGKTHTIALSLLRLLEAAHTNNLPEPRIVFLTAMTHAAIEAILSKLHSLIRRYRSIEDRSVVWLDDISFQHVTQGSIHNLPGPSRVHVYAGTVFQLWHFGRRLKDPVDMVVVDEAGQLCLGFLALVMRSLSGKARLVLAGDPQQLAPIFTGIYPATIESLFGSILDFLMPYHSKAVATSGGEQEDSELLPGSQDTSISSQISTVVQLSENFRLNADLGAFVQTIYSKPFVPQKSQDKALADQLRSLTPKDSGVQLDRDVRKLFLSLGLAMKGQAQSTFLQPAKRGRSSVLLGPSDSLGYTPISLALLRLQIRQSTKTSHASYESHVKAEANLAATIVRQLRERFPDESIFVATPHRIQRHAVRLTLRTPQDDNLLTAMGRLTLNTNQKSAHTGTVVVDTIERLQGSEAAFVICLFSHTHAYAQSSTGGSVLTFLLNRRRLNVAVSRAKTMCILVSSEQVLRPPASILADEESTKGYLYLREFEERAWCADVTVDLESGASFT